MIFFSRNRAARVSIALFAILALSLLLVAGWAIPAYVETGGAYWREGLGHDVGDRMVTGFQGHGASTFGWYLLGLPFYVLLFWVSALPWSPLLVARWRPLFSGKSFDWTECYLLGNAGLTFLVFSLMVTKLPHYTLPAFPFLALVFARRWQGAGLPVRLPRRVIALFGGWVAMLTLLIVPYLLSTGHSPSPVGELVRDAGDQLQPDTSFALVDFREPNAIWEMRRIVKSPATFIAEEEALPYLQQPGPRALILSTRAWDRIKTKADPTWKTYEAKGFNAARLAPLDLTLVSKKS